MHKRLDSSDLPGGLSLEHVLERRALGDRRAAALVEQLRDLELVDDVAELDVGDVVGPELRHVRVTIAVDVPIGGELETDAGAAEDAVDDRDDQDDVDAEADADDVDAEADADDVEDDADEEPCPWDDCPYSGSEHGLSVHIGRSHGGQRPDDVDGDELEVDEDDRDDQDVDVEGDAAPSEEPDGAAEAATDGGPEALSINQWEPDELVDALEGAQAVYHVARELDVTKDQARELLEELDLLDELGGGSPALSRTRATSAVAKHHERTPVEVVV